MEYIFRCGLDSQSDYIEFSNFNVELEDRKMTRLCGPKSVDVKNDILSDGNFFRVTFKSNDRYDALGFNAFYKFISIGGMHNYKIIIINRLT